MSDTIQDLKVRAYDLIRHLELTQQELRKVNEAIEAAERQVAMLAARADQTT